MAHPLTKVERLDWAADALSTHGSSGFNFVFLIMYPSVLVWVRLFHSIWLGLVCAAIVAAAALLYWRRHRFGILALGAVELAMAVLLAQLSFVQRGPFAALVPVVLFVIALAWVGILDLKRGMRFARVHGEVWNAESEEPISADEKVIVTSVRGMTVKVKKERG